MGKLSWEGHLAPKMSQKAYQRHEAKQKDGVYPPEMSRLDYEHRIDESPDSKGTCYNEENDGEDDFILHIGRGNRPVVNPPGKETRSYSAQGTQSPKADHIEARGLEGTLLG